MWVGSPRSGRAVAERNKRARAVRKVDDCVPGGARPLLVGWAESSAFAGAINSRQSTPRPSPFASPAPSPRAWPTPRQRLSVGPSPLTSPQKRGAWPPFSSMDPSVAARRDVSRQPCASDGGVDSDAERESASGRRRFRLHVTLRAWRLLVVRAILLPRRRVLVFAAAYDKLAWWAERHLRWRMMLNAARWRWQRAAQLAAWTLLAHRAAQHGRRVAVPRTNSITADPQQHLPSAAGGGGAATAVGAAATPVATVSASPAPTSIVVAAAAATASTAAAAPQAPAPFAVANCAAAAASAGAAAEAAIAAEAAATAEASVAVEAATTAEAAAAAAAASAVAAADAATTAEAAAATRMSLRTPADALWRGMTPSEPPAPTPAANARALQPPAPTPMAEAHVPPTPPHSTRPSPHASQLPTPKPQTLVTTAEASSPLGASVPPSQMPTPPPPSAAQQPHLSHLCEPSQPAAAAAAPGSPPSRAPPPPPHVPSHSVAPPPPSPSSRAPGQSPGAPQHSVERRQPATKRLVPSPAAPPQGTSARAALSSRADRSRGGLYRSAAELWHEAAAAQQQADWAAVEAIEALHELAPHLAAESATAWGSDHMSDADAGPPLASSDAGAPPRLPSAPPRPPSTLPPPPSPRTGVRSLPPVALSPALHPFTGAHSDVPLVRSHRPSPPSLQQHRHTLIALTQHMHTSPRPAGTLARAIHTWQCSWRVSLVRAQQHVLACATWHVRGRAAAHTAWWVRAYAARRLGAIEARVSSAKSRRMRRACLRTWRTRSAQHSRRRQLERTAAIRRARRVWRVWRRLTVAFSALERIAQSAAARLRRRQLASAWGVWCEELSVRLRLLPAHRANVHRRPSERSSSKRPASHGGYTSRRGHSAHTHSAIGTGGAHATWPPHPLGRPGYALSLRGSPSWTPSRTEGSVNEARVRTALRRWARRSAVEAQHAATAAGALAAFRTRQRYRATHLRRGWTSWVSWRLRRGAAKRVAASRVSAVLSPPHGVGSGGRRADGERHSDSVPVVVAGADGDRDDDERAQLWTELQKLRSQLDAEQQARRQLTFMERMHVAQLQKQTEALRRSLLTPQRMGGAEGSHARSTVPLGLREAANEPARLAATRPPQEEVLRAMSEYHRRLGEERARHAGLATELRFFAKQMNLDATPVV